MISFFLTIEHFRLPPVTEAVKLPPERSNVTGTWVLLLPELTVLDKEQFSHTANSLRFIRTPLYCKILHAEHR